MLPCVCSVIDHRWRQNVVRTKKWHTRRSRGGHWWMNEWMNVYLYTAHITSYLMAVYNSLERDRTSACEGASGCRYQSIFDLTHPPNPCMKWEIDHNTGNYVPYTDVLTTFWRLLWSITESDARHHGIYLFYNNNEKPFFIWKFFIITRKPAFCPAFAPPLHEKKPFDVIYLFKMKQFHWLLCVAKNCDWSRKIAPLSNLTRAPSPRWKLTAKAELNCDIYKSWRKCWKNQVS